MICSSTFSCRLRHCLTEIKPLHTYIHTNWGQNTVRNWVSRIIILYGLYPLKFHPYVDFSSTIYSDSISFTLSNERLFSTTSSSSFPEAEYQHRSWRLNGIYYYYRHEEAALLNEEEEGLSLGYCCCSCHWLACSYTHAIRSWFIQGIAIAIQQQQPA